MKTMKISAKTGSIPLKKMKSKSKFEVPEAQMQKLKDGSCDYIQTGPIGNRTDRMRAQSSFSNKAKRLGFKVKTYTTKDNRVVAFIKGGAA